MKKTITALALLVPSIASAVEWPETDAGLDKLLRQRSSRYRDMAASIEKRGPYRIESGDDVRLGDVQADGPSGLRIVLNSRLVGARRATVLIWEVCNAFQRPRFDEMDRRARDGAIATSKEFGLRMELIEYDSFRHHRKVLEDLDSSLGPIGAEYLFFINPEIKDLKGYEIPYVHDYIEAQARSGHTEHYETWYHRQRGKSPVADKGE